MTITSANLTSGVSTSTDGNYIVTGDGVFDDLMETINTHLDAQFKLGRITGTDYATVYIGAMQAAMQQSVAYIAAQEKNLLDQAKSAAEVSLLDQKTITEFNQTGRTDTSTLSDVDSILGKQAELYKQQALGFRWNADQKYLKTLLDTWSINASAGIFDDQINDIQAPALNILIPEIRPSEDV